MFVGGNQITTSIKIEDKGAGYRTATFGRLTPDSPNPSILLILQFISTRNLCMVKIAQPFSTAVLRLAHQFFAIKIFFERNRRGRSRHADDRAH